MGLSINNNIAALNSYRNLSSTQNDLSKSLEKLSSGLRINRAADDAAGLAISEGLRAQIGGTKQAVRNAQDGISVVQTAEGALTETHSILQRMRTLSVQAGNDGGLSNSAKSNIQDEMDQLKTELTRIADTTQFNGTKLLNGNYNGTFQVGANTAAADKISVDLTGSSMGAVGLGVDGVNVTNTGTSWTADVDLAAAVAPSGAVGALSITTAAGVTNLALDLTAWDTTGTSDAAKANHALLNDELSKAVSSTNFSASVDSYGKVTIGGAGITAASALTVAAASTPGSGSADAAINSIDAAITKVSGVRSQLGAVQNRFDHTINNLNVAVENLSASESRVRDTDMAQEMVSFTRSQILSQAGTAMLAQAKSLPQSVLQLLQ
ncbi:flagellin N-terminal helical domain-containing protein [Cellulomonas gilvus]|uniref:Flagellin n=1 Tax=Cellulomonas gilvus (strain ATCC 13127 / NRRL B-14078) TaxID=593907 RepID=F8A5F5_CELGA|nr:flagellin [Cellulomonas gilvus]AEI10972.1 flagellin domain protein [Cellulomonas gilvus ATCC 13127]